MAFPRDGEGAPPARLWLKLSSADQFPDLTRRLGQRAAADPRIELIDRHLSPEAFDALYREADVLLSLHRSEGFGLTLAEAMAAGLPVVASGYSGNLEFMDSDSALLVPAPPVTIQHSQGDSRRGCRWGEPCVATAALHLRRLAADPATARRLAMAGRQAVADRLAPGRLAAIVAERVGSLLRWGGRSELLAALPAGHPLAALQ
jgi:glycosyltransferase involved in cell wall biosynthesis